MKPNLFVVGAPKCGTSSLAKYLSEHPQVYFSPIKEPMYLSDDLGREPHDLAIHSQTEYDMLFDGADPQKHRVIAEGSTSYLRSKSAITQMATEYKLAKLIVMLRNPIDIAHAFHMEQRHTGLEPLVSFEAAWNDQEQRERHWASMKGQSPDSILYRKVSAIGSQLSYMISQIDTSRIKIVFLEDLRDSPRETWAEIQNFLELSPDNRMDFQVTNSSHELTFPKLSHFFFNPPPILKQPIIKFRKFLISNPRNPINLVKRTLIKKVNRAKISKSFRKKLYQSYFKPEIKKIEAITNKKLYNWHVR